MNREEAQFILGAYRPSSEDARDPQFQEALALAASDPELARWFAVEQALDRAFSAQLRSRPMPADLKALLLLARTTARGAPWWRRPAWLALAACVALLLAAAGSRLFRGRGDSGFAAFRTAMTSVASDMSDHIDVFGLGPAELKTWLAAHRGDPDFILPPGLAAHGIAGCKVLEWRGHSVTMLCIKLSGKHVDVFVIDAADLPRTAFGVEPLIVASAEATSATWRRDGRIYHLVGNLPRAELQQLL